MVLKHSGKLVARRNEITVRGFYIPAPQQIEKPTSLDRLFYKDD